MPCRQRAASRSRLQHCVQVNQVVTSADNNQTRRMESAEWCADSVPRSTFMKTSLLRSRYFADGDEALPPVTLSEVVEEWGSTYHEGLNCWTEGMENWEAFCCFADPRPQCSSPAPLPLSQPVPTCTTLLESLEAPCVPLWISHRVSQPSRPRSSPPLSPHYAPGLHSRKPGG